LLDHFAGLAMQAFIQASLTETCSGHFAEAARGTTGEAYISGMAYAQADAMIAERKRNDRAA